MSHHSHNEKKALKQEEKALKHQDKHLHKQDKHLHKQDKHHHHGLGTTAAVPLAGSGLGATSLAREGAPVVHTSAVPIVAPMQNLTMADRVVHEPERVIRHEPILEKEVLNESTLEVRREHHIQPIVHETEHRIQPIIKTEATTEQPVIVQDRNVMLAPVVERAALPVGLEAVERVAAEGIIHAPKLETMVVNERPVEVRREHHIQPIVHEREHRIQPIIKTQATTETTLIEQDRNVMHAPIVERAAMPEGLGAVERVAAEGIIHAPKVDREVIVEHPVEVRHERHIQPIVHEREHHIQPIIKTEVTAEQKHIKTDRNVMLAPVVERAALPLGLEAVERSGPEGVVHRAKLEKEVIVEHPVQIKHEHHVQPVIHERVHHIQPVIKTEVTTEQRVMHEEHTVMLPPIIEPTVMMPSVAAAPRAAAAAAMPMAGAAPIVATTTLPRTAGVLPLGNNTAKPLPQIPQVNRATQPLVTPAPGMLASERTLGYDHHHHHHNVSRDVPLAASQGALGTGAAIPHKPTMGQRLKGAVKQLQGSVTGNELKKEEGKLISSGVDPLAAKAATTPAGTTPTTTL